MRSEPGAICGSMVLLIALAIAPSTAWSQRGNDMVRRCTDEGTTYDKTRCKTANVGLAFEFKGSVHDVKDANTLTVQLSAGNFADVVFEQNVGDFIQKDQEVTFTGIMQKFGTGIIVNHDIAPAALTGKSASGTPTTTSAEKKTARCKTMFQAWVFNNLLEEACHLNGGVARKLGIAAKSACGTPSNSEWTTISFPVMSSIRADVDQLGKEEFCRRNLPGYADLARP